MLFPITVYYVYCGICIPYIIRSPLVLILTPLSTLTLYPEEAPIDVSRHRGVAVSSRTSSQYSGWPLPGMNSWSSLNAHSGGSDMGLGQSGRLQSHRGWCWGRDEVALRPDPGLLKTRRRLGVGSFPPGVGVLLPVSPPPLTAVIL